MSSDDNLTSSFFALINSNGESLNDHQVVELILLNTGILREVLASETAKDILLTDMGLFTPLLSDSRLKEALLSSPEYIHKWFSDNRMVELVLSNDSLLHEVLSSDIARNTLLSDLSLFTPFLSEPRLGEAIISSPEYIDRWLSNEYMVEMVLSNSNLLREVLGSQKARNSLLSDMGLLKPLLPDSRLHTSLFSSPRYINKWFRDQCIASLGVNSDTEIDYPIIDRLNYVGEFLSKVKIFREFSCTYENKEFNERLQRSLLRILNGSRDIQNLVLDVFLNDLCVNLRGYDLEAFDRRSIWILLHELFINQDYYFECPHECPYIIDCGSSFGVSVIFFKSLYPKSSVLAFEPQAKVRKLLEKNITNNNIDDVQVLPYALYDREGTLTFHESDEDCLGASLDLAVGDTESICEVQCRKLSQYINQRVDFLKLDIEGAENRVLLEIKDKLHLVDRVFCEYHSSEGEDANRLLSILQVLDEAGFKINVSKSYSGKKYTDIKPFQFVGDKYSSVIFASKL